MTRESVAVEDLESANRQPEEILPAARERFFRVTSSTHGKDNYITTDPEVIEQAITMLETKLTAVADEIAECQLEGEETDPILLIVYGVTARAARDAVKILRKDGFRVSLLILKTLFPVPDKHIKKAIKGREKVFVIEMNRGQYVHEVQRVSATVPVGFIGQMNGELIPPETIAAEVIQ